MSETIGPFLIFNGHHRYIDVEYTTLEAAERERLNLLRHFPKTSPWWQKLRVAPKSEERRPYAYRKSQEHDDGE